MENNLQNKAKFFAQYWWQKVFVAKGDDDTYNNWRPEEFDKVYMLLKPLSDISDEDAIELCVFLKYNNYETLSRTETDLTIFEKDVKSYRAIPSIIIDFETGLVEWDNGESWDDNRTTGFNCYAYDFLRSKGYLLPFNGLSTEELISRGWAVLTSNHTVNK